MVIDQIGKIFSVIKKQKALPVAFCCVFAKKPSKEFDNMPSEIIATGEFLKMATKFLQNHNIPVEGYLLSQEKVR